MICDTMGKLEEYLLSEGVEYLVCGNKISAGGSLYLNSLTTLPDGITLSAGRSLYLNSLTTLPDGITLSAGGSLYLNSLTTLPDGITLSAGSNLHLNSLTALPDGITLSAGGSLDLRRLTALPDGVTLSAGGYLDLRRLTALPDGVTLSAGGSLDLRRLTALPDGITLSAGRSLYLNSLTTLPDGITLSAGGSLYLNSLTAQKQKYHGKTITLETIDGVCTRLISSRLVGGTRLWSAQYFKGDLEKDKRCYVAESDGLYSHGDTAEEALRDLRFKIAQVNFDADDLIETIKRRGTVTFNDYRLLTGACASGLAEGLKSRGIPPDVEELPLKNVLELCRGGYGGEKFRTMLGASS